MRFDAHPCRPRTVAVRINGLSTPWGADDIRILSFTSHFDVLVVPKVESNEGIRQIEAECNKSSMKARPFWAMIETPIGVLAADQIASNTRVDALVMGTSDLVKELGARHTRDRLPLAYAMQRYNLLRQYATLSLSKPPLSQRPPSHERYLPLSLSYCD